MKTRRPKQALDKHGFDAAIGGAAPRRGRSRAPRSASSFPQRAAPLGPEEPAPGAVEPVQRAQAQGRVGARFPINELDRADVWLYIQREEHPDRAVAARAAERPVVERDGALIMVDDERLPLREGERRR